MIPGGDFIGVQNTPGGVAAGPKLLASLFVPAGMGLVFTNPDDGTFWQLRLAQNPDGTTYIGEDSKPTIELIQVGL